MKTDPIIEELWRIKDQLAAAAGQDMDVFLQQLEAWSAAHPPTSAVIPADSRSEAVPARKAPDHYAATPRPPSLVREPAPPPKPDSE